MGGLGREQEENTQADQMPALWTLQNMGEDMNAEINTIKAIVMANARQLIRAKKATTNGKLYAQLFGTGQTTAMRACTEDIGLDPDSNRTDFYEMARFISRKKEEESE